MVWDIIMFLEICLRCLSRDDILEAWLELLYLEIIKFFQVLADEFFLFTMFTFCCLSC